MKPIDYRNSSWNDVRDKLNESRLEVWEAWRKFGPGTTADVAEKSGICILTFRPRTTDLFQIGFVALVDTVKKARQGVYRALSEAEALHEFRLHQARANDAQLQLL